MTTSRNARPEPSSGDGLMGASTLGVALIDGVLLTIFLVGLRLPGWESVFQFWSLFTFLLALLVLGLAACAGIVLRSMGARSGIASRRLPFFLVAVRTALVMSAMPLLALFPGSDAAGSIALMSGYCIPTTLLLLVVSVVGLTRHRSGAQT
jgi:hypothetical protein